MPPNESFRLNNRENLQDRGKPAVKVDQEQSIQVRKVDPATNLTPQHHHLMPKRRVLGLKSAIRLEWQGQGGNDDAQQREHCAMTLCDSVS